MVAIETSSLERFTALLGDDVFFVPCEWGTKRPIVTYVERPFEGTKTPAYALYTGLMACCPCISPGNE